MMSNNDEDVDLGLSLGSTNYRAEPSLNGEDNNNLGGGVNAATSRIDDLIFASSDDPLSELVWSPRSGLSLKCADSSLPSDHRPFFLFNVRPTLNEIDDDKVVDDENLIISSYNLIEPHADQTDESKDDVATHWIKNASTSDAIIRAIPIRSEPDKKPSQLLVRNMQSQQELDEEVTSATGKVNKNKAVMMSNSNYAGPVLNTSALCREKGKEKAMSDEGSSADGPERCNSASIFSKGVKRRREGKIGSERPKKKIQESSFMNWISNVAKGHSECNRVDGPLPSVPLAMARPNNACGNKSSNMGFHTIFQSIYGPKAKDGFAIEESKISDKQIVVLNKDKTVAPSVSSREHANIAENNKNNNNTSLWITRFYTRTDGLKNRERITEKARDSSVQRPKVNVEKISECILHPSENIKKYSDHKNIICNFCGKSGHDIRKCSQLTKTELDGLLVKVGSFEGVDEKSPCLCIRCFQFGHWAISCPSGKADVARKVMDSTKFAPCNFVNTQNTDEMFCAIRKLRLSRTDILRWMNSNVSLLHLNGFFLRLRLRKLEAGLGGTGYYVARITEDTVQNLYCDSNKSILVDVGGIKSSVGSRYVSNNDFVEDEIKAWWSRIVKTGGKIPSLDELKSKAKDRTCLGF
ncbi:hypothetical protein CASFOL_005476 [Castilleja foliolosa]|uniref:Uncharacterized protein n=1 Tax=Castilleja foliolosa TaxID=1961234 RepID=A0ABD3E3I7_9LAMI